MWIVELALKRPHTFIVLAITIVMFGMISIFRTPIDIFPTIDIPVATCVFTCQGMSPYNMENLVTTVTERALTSTINGIQYMESISVAGMSVIKIYLNKGTDMGQSVAMVASVGTAVLRQLPRGIFPPFVCASSATDVPVLQLGLQSDTLSEAQLFDIANNRVRSQLAVVQGTTIPFPYGGKYRQVMVDLDPNLLLAHGVSAYDVVKALNTQSVIAPTGTIKMGPFEYVVVNNNIPDEIDKLNDLPIKSENGATIYIKDVANVHDGAPPQINIVNRNGKRAVLFNILKSGSASTLAVVQRVKQVLPQIASIVPPACKINILTDQSIFVRECMDEVVREAATACGLTALMMLLLLGSWRSTLIVATSIPLAMLCSIIGLACLGETINSMTLGGLALAVGMLVDDATVAIENLHVNLDMGKDIVTAILDGARQVALPALVSTLSICIVFVPVFFLTEPAHSLFVPLGLAVVLAMLASYGLSRTLVPLMSKYLLASETKKNEKSAPKHPTVFTRIHDGVEFTFEKARGGYGEGLTWVLEHPRSAAALFLGFYAISFLLFPFVGEEFFPAIDSGALRLHVTAPPGTRVEETERLYKHIEKAINNVVPPNEIDNITDNIGLPMSGINFAYSDSQTISEADGEILISLKENRSHSTFYYQSAIRNMIHKDFPEAKLYFQPADIVTQILNAGLPAPIDIKVLGFNRQKNLAMARAIRQQVSMVPGAVDVCLHQVPDAPNVQWNVDRLRAEQMRLSQKDVSNSYLISLSSSFQNYPNFWPDTISGITYNLAAQIPQYRIGEIDDLRVMPVTQSAYSQTAFPLQKQAQPTAAPDVHNQFQPFPQLLTNLATFDRNPTPAAVSHIDVQPTYDVYASIQGRDLGSVGSDIKKILMGYKSQIKRGTFIIVFGQIKSMVEAFSALFFGLAFAIVLVYLLLVVNFQSWTDPLIILMAIPGAFSGIIWSLFVTQTHLSIPALMGTIMTVGVASANSILMVTFANDELAKGLSPKQSAFNAGVQRFRPVIMTALAMIIGMIPMAIGAGSGGSQNAPIGRAVIGGLLVATFSTLLFVPMIFCVFRSKWSRKHVDS